MNKRQKVIDFLSKRYNNILKSKQDGTISWVAIKDEFHQETGFDLHKDYFRSVFKAITPVESVSYIRVGDIYNKISTEELTGWASATSFTTKTPFIYINGNEDKTKGTKLFTFTADNIPTEDEIINHFNIDTTKYRINQIYHKTSFGGKYAITVSCLLNKQQENNEDYKKLFIDFINQNNKNILKNDFSYLKKDISGNKEIENALIISLADLHLDVKTFQSETGNDSDMYKSFDRALLAVKDILYRATYGHGIEEIIFIGGNDFYHANSAKNTTEKGTPLDVDGRFHESFKLGLTLITTILDICKVYAPVRYYTCYGNHSPEREFYLAAALDAYYRNDEKIKIETDPKSRKYFSYGNSAFMLSHDAPKSIKDLPVIFATENPLLFTMKYKFLLTGHLHSKQETFFIGTKDNFGLVWKRMPSLAKSDKWHFDSFFIGNQKSCIGLVINKNHGEIAEYIYNE